MFYKEKELVVSPTRNPKPISQTAENITVITARDIENMNAHTIAEVLSRVPGMYVAFNQDFGATSLFQSQGSEDRHVLVMIDGVRWNYLNSGAAETNSIPVGIIERIEVIKGPASSSWGSALGGVINIITKQVGTTTQPTGVVSADFGENETRDLRAQAAGKAGQVGYFLYAGRQDSDGLKANRDFENYSLYSKLQVPLTGKVKTEFTVGYSEPEIDLGNYLNTYEPFHQTGKNRNFFATGSLDAALTSDLSFKMSFHKFKQKAVLTADSLGLLIPGDPLGTRFEDGSYDEETTGGDAKFIWQKDRQTVVLGGEFDHGELDQTIKSGDLLQSWGSPAVATTHPRLDRWGIFVNDTIVINRWSITPGVRYDRNSITGSFVSPSIGVTYQVWKDSLLRASVARGFTMPPLAWSSGGGLFLDPNHDLDSEKILSYQIGAETAALQYLWLKVTLFRHEVDDTLTKVLYGGGPPLYNDIFENKGKSRRQGGELEMQTVSFYNFYLLGGASFVHFTPQHGNGYKNIYSYSVGLRYDDNRSFRAELFGRYVWWNMASGFNAQYDNFIWDLNVTKKVFSWGKTATEVFLTGHNLFSGSQYTVGDSKNPQRWIESGMRIKF